MKVALLFGSLAVGLVLMIGFDVMLTRILGVLALFTFIITGVFLIADPAFLERADGSLARTAASRVGWGNISTRCQGR